MPCYQVQTANVNLNNANHRLLAEALTKIGYRVTLRQDGKIRSFTRDRVTGTYDGQTLHLEAPAGVRIDTDEIKRAYAERVIRKKVDEASAAGWDVEKEGDEWVFRKPRNRLARVHA